MTQVPKEWPRFAARCVAFNSTGWTRVRFIEGANDCTYCKRSARIISPNPIGMLLGYLRSRNPRCRRVWIDEAGRVCEASVPWESVS